MPQNNKTDKVAKEVPGSIQGMFVVNFLLVPAQTMSLDEITDLLHNMQIVLEQEVFLKLRESTRRHFVIQQRDGSVTRYVPEKRGRPLNK